MSKLVYKTPLSEEMESILASVLAQSVDGTVGTSDLTEEELEW